MKKAIIYLRVSTEEQAERGFSIYAQKEECTTKAHELGCDKIIECIDEGVSGSILERPMLMNAMELLKNEQIDFFICFDSSRLSRNVAHQLILIDTINKHGAKLLFVRTNYEDTAEGRFQLTIMAAVDEYERARLKIRTELGKRAKAKQKLLTHNPGLYGYEFDKVSDTLRINQTQAQIVRMMYNWLLQDKLGPAEIAQKLNMLQIPSMRGKQWSRVSINRILNNFSYTGTLFIRRYDTRDYKLNKYKTKEQKVRVTQRPKDQWIPIDVPAIIELETWQRTKLQLEKAKRVFKKGTKEYYLLSGLLRCSECGGTLFGRSTSQNGQHPNKYYCCINKYNYSKPKEERCKSRLYKADDLENSVWGFIKAKLLNKTEINRVLENISTKPKHDNSAAIEQLLDQKKKEKERIITLFQKGIIIEAELKQRLKDIKKAIECLSDDYQKALKLRNCDNNIKASDTIERIEAHIQALDILQKNKLLHNIIKEIMIKDNSLKIRALIPDKFSDTNFREDTLLVSIASILNI